MGNPNYVFKTVMITGNFIHTSYSPVKWKGKKCMKKSDIVELVRTSKPVADTVA